MDSADLSEAVEKGEPIVVVDGRSADAYAQEHIPGAISLPHRGISYNSTALLDKSKLYVCYCDGIGCNALDQDCAQAPDAGLPGARASSEAWDWWKRDGHATHGEGARDEAGGKCAC